MREAFEDRKLHGNINIANRFDDGSVRYWTTTKEEVVKHIVQVVTQYAKLGYSLTLRQLHYQFVKSNWIVNHQTSYKKLGTILDDCRYGGVIDWDAIVDRGRQPYIPYSVDSIEEALEDAVKYYRRNRQDDQERIVEVWTEKDALSDIIKRSTEKYHVRLCVNKGYTSSSAIYGAYERILEYFDNDKPVTILYIGDHDPSGLDMVRDIQERLYFMLQKGRREIEDPEDWLTIRHIALTTAQVREYNLPPNPTKMTDTRSEGYIAVHGHTCWEVDALDPETLTAIIEENIEDVIDMDTYEETVKEERAQAVKIRSLVNNLNKDEDEES